METLFQNNDDFRCIATRCDKTASPFLGVIHLAAIWLWIRKNMSALS